MRQLVLEKIVVSGFPPVNKRCLWLKGNTFYFWYKGAWRSIDTEIDINNEYIDERVSEVVSQEITNVMGDAPENMDTLGEVAEHLGSHEVEATRRDEEIDVLKEKVKTLEESGTGGGNSGWIDVS